MKRKIKKKLRKFIAKVAWNVWNKTKAERKSKKIGE